MKKTMRSRGALALFIGRQTISIPYHQLSARGGYDFALMGVSGFSVGAGAHYNSGKPSDWSEGRFTLSDVTVFDAMVAFAHQGWRVAVNATNVSDKTYLEACNYSCSYGEPRKVIGTVTYRW